MKTKSYKIILFVFSLAMFTLSACEDGSDQIAALNQENSELRNNYQTQLKETRIVTKSADSLYAIILSRRYRRATDPHHVSVCCT